MSDGPDNLLTEWARLLLGTLAQAGVAHLVMSPGSRSTPFVAAATQVEGLRLHDVIDERAAAFLALGIARATGAPSALLCTSGSAGAHYFPAVIEASLARLPLVVITADRPPELQDCGAAQTIDQIKLYGGHVRRFADLGIPSARRDVLKAMRRTVAQVVELSRSPVPGPVHLNARARKPLEPGLPTNDAGQDLREEVTSLLATRVPHASAANLEPNPGAIEAVAASMAKAERGLIVYGPSSIDAASHRQALFDLASWTGFPLLAEATSQMRLGQVPEGVVVCDAFDLVLKCAAFRAGPAPDLVLQFGDTPTSGAWEAYARFDASKTERVVLHPHAWLDPQGSVSRVVFGDTGRSIVALAEASKRHPRSPPAAREAWRARFAEADREASSVIDEDLASEAGFGEGEAVRTLVRALPDGSILVAGNSLPIRHLDLFAERGAKGVTVLCQRGANGIDGMVAGTAGASRALDRKAALLIGDVSLFHDVSSLALLAGASSPIVVVVLHNKGGRIFEQLALGAMADKTQGEVGAVALETLKHIVTENDFAFEHAARFAGVEHAVAGDEGTLQRELERAFGRRGGTLIEVPVPEHGAAIRARRLLACLEARLGKISNH